MRSPLLVFLFLLPGLASAQARLTQLTNAQRAHIDAKISATGSHVAFRVGRTDLGVVPFTGGSESLIFTSATGNLGSFVWDDNGTTLYVADGATVRSVPRGGGSTITIGTISGTSVALWCTDAQYVYGSRQSGAQAMVFRVRKNGQGQPADVATVTGTVDEVAISPARGFLLIANGSGVPFTAPTMLRHDIQAGSTQPLGQPVWPLNSIAWLDEGLNFVASSRTALVGAPQVVRFDIGTNPTPYTELAAYHRRTWSHGGNWIVCETLSPTGNGVTLALVRTLGGGVVHVDAGRMLLVNGGAQYGGLTLDQSESRIAVCGGAGAGDPFPQIWVATLNREIEVTPRLQTGQPFTIGLPMSAIEIGAVAVSFGLAVGQTIVVPPLVGEFYLDTSPGNMITAVSGLATGGQLVGTFQIPGDPGLVGTQLWFQGVRLDPSFQGAFTRFGQYQVF